MYTTRLAARLLGACLGLLTLSSSTVLAQETDNRWTPAGPQFSTIFSLERDPSNPGTLLAGAYFGGLYRSTDYGFSWQPLESPFSSRSIFAIAYVSSTTIYVGTFNDGVYRTTDGGTTWTAANNGLTSLDVQAIAADPSASDVLLAATSNGGVFRTTNGGGLWTRVDESAHPLRGKAIAFDPDHAGVVYLGTIGEGAFRSSDGGQSFQPANEGLTAASILSLRFGAGPGRDLYAATDDGAFKRKDGSTTWVNISGNLPKLPLSDLLPHPLLKRFSFVATLVGVYVIADDEATSSWTQWTTMPTRTLATDPTGTVFHQASIHGGMEATVNFGQTWYQANWGIQNLFVGALKVTEFGGTDIVYAGSDYALHRGAFGAWETFFDQKQGIFDLQADPAQPSTLYLGSEKSGVWKSTDGGAAWQSASTNLVPSQIYALGQAADGQTFYAGTSSGLYLGVGNGDNWLPSSAADFGIALSVAPDPTRAPYLFVGGANGKVLFSEDGGWSYRFAGNGLPNENIVGLVTAPWEKTYAITASGGLLATSDNGLNWFPAKSGVSEPASAIAAEPQRAWVLYLGTMGGGVYKSESGSLDWTPKNSGLTSPWVFSVAVNPATPETVYAGTFDGVFRSVNGGTTWVRTSTGLAAGAVTSLLVTTSGQAVYAAIQDAGLYRSTDAGANWTPVTGGLPTGGAQPLLVNRLDPAQIFAGTALNGVYRSSNSGASWQSSSYGMTLFIRGVAIDPVTPSTVYAGSLGAGVFKTLDGGTSWQNVGLRDRNIFKLAIDPQHPATVFAATSRGVSRTTDGGQTWSGLGQRAAFINSLVVDPADRRRVFVGTTAGSIYRSVNGGDTWEAASAGLPGATVQSLALDGSSGVLYAGLERAGVWRSPDAGASWTKLSHPAVDGEFISSLTVTSTHTVVAATLDTGVFAYAGGSWSNISTGLASPKIADVKATTGGVLLAATFDAGVFRSTNNGSTWTWASSGLTTDRVNALSPDPLLAARIYASTPDGVFRSDDGGASWQAANSGLVGVNTWTVTADPVVSGRVFAGTNGRGVFVSTNSGASWSAASSGLVNLDVRAIAPGAAAGSLYAGTLGAGVARSANAGATWTGRATLDVTDSFVLALAVNPVNPSVLYAATAGRGVLKSINGGIDWAPVSNGLGSLFLLSLVIDRTHPDTLYAGTADSGVFVTTNGGASWQALNTGLFNHVVTSLALSPLDSARVYAGTEGGGVFTARVSVPAVSCTVPEFLPFGNIPAAGGTFTIDVSTGATCPWRVESASDWLAADGETMRTGPGSVTVTVVANPGQDARSGLVNVAGRPVGFAQGGVSVLNRLSISKTGSGAGRVSTDAVGIDCGPDCAQMFVSQLVTLIATPEQGSLFAGWEGHADCTDGSVTMTGDRACIARFEASDDFDSDGLDNLWEVKFGLDPGSASGDDGPDGDPDHDGRTNAQEQADGTHPRGFAVTYFARGVAGGGDTTRIALFNPAAAPAHVLVRIVPDSGGPAAEYRSLAARGRAVIDTQALATAITGSFAAIIESDEPVVAERTIFQAAPAATDAAGAATAATQWLVAAGTSKGGQQTAYAFFNPGAAGASLTITYLPPGQPPVTRHHTIAAGARLHVDANADSGLTESDFAAAFESSAAIVAEVSVATADRKAITAETAARPGYLQFLADGRTGTGVTSRLDLFNPTGGAADITLTYLLNGGGFAQKVHHVAAFARLTVDPATDDGLLTTARFGVIGSAPSPFVMTLSSWWPGAPADWYEGVMANALPAAGVHWAAADGEQYSTFNSETEIAIMNVSGVAGSATVTLVFDDGTSASRTVAVPAVRQLVLDIGALFPEAAWRAFSAEVTSVSTGSGQPLLVVERVTYISPNGVAHAGGARTGAALLP